MWTTAIVGIVGTVVGLLVGHILSASREHTKWVNDQKRLEYRELLDQLYETVTIISVSRPNLRENNLAAVNEATKKLSRALSDRIFIADTLRESNALDDWIKMKKILYYEPGLQSETPIEFRYSANNLHEREDSLRNKILELAKKDIAKFKPF